MKYVSIHLLLIGILLLASAVAAQTIIDPADSEILYVGRWDDSNPAQPWCYWIGSAIIVQFSGTAITADMGAGESGRPDYLRIIVDGDAANSTKIPVSASMSTYTLASGLMNEAHKVEIIKETDIGRWTLHSFELEGNAALMSPPARPSRKMVFYGDSNLAGYSLESEQNQGEDELRGSYRGYAGIASRMLDAEYQNISRSGATISSLHDVFDRIDYGSTTPLWDFNRFSADIVVLNIGANDVGRPVHKIKGDYHALLDDLRSAHSSAHIVVYNAWGWDYDEPANFTQDVVAERDDPDMSFATFPWIFEQWHGCEYDHAGMAQVLVNHLSTVLGWPQGPGDVMSGFGAGGDLANGSFEEEAPFGGYGWRYYTDSGVSRIHDPVNSFDGEYHLRLQDGASVHQPNPASDGQTFNVILWMRGAEIGDEIDVTMDFRDQEMWTLPLKTETETFVLGTDWQRYSMTATAPTGTMNPVYHTRLTLTSAVGDIVDIDALAMNDVTAVQDFDPMQPRIWLSVSPNPFNPRVNIEFMVLEPGSVLLTVYDVSGRRIAILANGQYPRGISSRRWDGRDDNGIPVGSGTYFARMVAGERIATSKMVLIR